ncbi:exostosin domain-containing protein [Neotamlana laminarinivorans]|uniref:Glycosyltransferase family 47 protein n=1 Tax=Neotamlana laminarinivorans TaxID=2883124 RepID=A0A9X1I0J7_9FLAO|nr:exostosin family protein [Tamlana laminarinivorans]MCB4798996.1 glycosyltransferase family 47 protein [Tamlana laminarinivorans]
MKLFLTSAYPYNQENNFAVNWLKNLAEETQNPRHAIVENPEEADVILFLEQHLSDDPYYFQVIKHELTKKYKQKVILYADVDRPLPILPMLSPTLEKSYFNKGLCYPAPFIARQTTNDSVVYTELSHKRKYLFSFLGSCTTNKTRYKILDIQYQNCFLKDTSKLVYWKLSNKEKLKLTQESVDVYKNSYFVLCPRGIGPDTYRVYEVMQMGLVPVIISDEWVPMNGPNWDEFAIRVKENEVHKIPEILEAKKEQAIHMGNLARENWENWFSNEVMFNVLADCAESLHKNKKNNRLGNLYYSYSQFFRKFHSRALIRHLRRKIKKSKDTEAEVKTSNNFVKTL